MNGFDELVSRLTRRLRVDPELQREVAHELRTHLEDTAGEFRAAGAGEAESLAAAAKAMGNEDEVADQLWQANRNRMQVRRVVRWAAGATLMPTAVAVSVGVAWSAILSVALALPMLVWGSGLGRSLSGYVTQGMVASLPAESRLVVDASGRWGQDAPVEKARLLAEGHPGDAVYWGYYTTVALAEKQVERKDLPRVMAILDQGEKIEPGNAFYPLCRAALLLSTSATGLGQGHDFAYVGNHGEKGERFWGDLRIFDTDAFQKGLSEYLRAMQKPYLDSHCFDFADRRAALLPPPTRLSDQMFRSELDQHLLNIRMPYWCFSGPASRADSYAVGMAAQGRGPEVLPLVQAHRTLALLISRSARTTDVIMDASREYREAMMALAMVYNQMGDPRQSDRAVQAGLRQGALLQSILRDAQTRQTDKQFFRQAGLAEDRYFVMAVDPERVGATFGRAADYAVMDRLGLAVLLIVLTVVGAAPALGAVVSRVRTGRWPAIGFVGWRRLAIIVAVAAIVPIGAYACMRISPIAGRDSAIWFSLERVVVEYAAVACVVLVLLRLLSDAAMRRRAIVLEAPELIPADPGKAQIRAGLVVAAAVLVYLVVWHAILRRVEPEDHGIFSTGGCGLLLALAVVLHGLTWLVASNRADASQTGQWWRCLPAVVASAAALGGAAIAARRAWGPAMDQEHWWLLASTSLIIAGVTALGLVLLMSTGVLMARPRRVRPDLAVAPDRGLFDYRLSIAPAILLAGLVLSVVAGLPLRLQEKAAVGAMNTPGGSCRMVNGLDQSYLRAVKEQLDDLSRQGPDAL
jgi:hypothetical protein